MINNWNDKNQGCFEDEIENNPINKQTFNKQTFNSENDKDR